MKTIIAGGRNFGHYGVFHNAMEDLGQYVTEVVCGAAAGADQMGAEWAVDRGLKIQMFPPDWERWGTAAGPIRNKEMAEYADVLVAFWDGKSKGTANMIKQALSNGLEVHVYRY